MSELPRLSCVKAFNDVAPDCAPAPILNELANENTAEDWAKNQTDKTVATQKAQEGRLRAEGESGQFEGYDINGMAKTAGAMIISANLQQQEKNKKHKDLILRLEKLNKDLKAFIEKMNLMIRNLEFLDQLKAKQEKNLKELKDLIDKDLFQILEKEKQDEWLIAAGLNPDKFETVDEIRAAIDPALDLIAIERQRIQESVKILIKHRDAATEMQNEVNAFLEGNLDNIDVEYHENLLQKFKGAIQHLGLKEELSQVELTEEMYKNEKTRIDGVYNLIGTQDNALSSIATKMAIHKFELKKLEILEKVEQGYLSPNEMNQALKEEIGKISKSHRDAYNELINKYPDFKDENDSDIEVKYSSITLPSDFRR